MDARRKAVSVTRAGLGGAEAAALSADVRIMRVIER